MDPPSKRRRLAPKVPDAPPPALPPPPPPPPPLPPPHSQPTHGPPYPPEQQQPPVQHHAIPEAPPTVPERQDFEAFARHLQDAAMLISRQARKSRYTNVSVLLLRWEEDTTVEHDLGALEKVLRERYSYQTSRWAIPTVPNPSIKLGVQMASFLEHARADHLLIIYYAGHGYVGADNQLYWACNAREDAAKLKWDGVRCLFEDAQSDILLLLDSCAVKDVPKAGSHGVKQAIAACTPDQAPREPGTRSFTAHLADSLCHLSMGRPFSVQRLYEDVLARRQHELAQSRLPNGANQPPPGPERAPVFLTLTPGTDQSLSLIPLALRGPPPPAAPPAADADGQGTKRSRDDQLMDPAALVDLTFDEPRVLVCTTFVGEASPDMAFFHQWVNNTPPLASRIAVEGMFLGPPTMLLISMPQPIWNIVQHDKVCCFLGYITSHDMTNVYARLLGSSPGNPPTTRDVEHGRILLEARAAASSSPATSRHDAVPQPPAAFPHTPTRQRPGSRAESGLPLPHAVPHANSTPAAKDEVEDSAEIKEAAEQLKALSHIRHMSDEAPPRPNHVAARHAENGPDGRHDDTGSSHEANGSGEDENHARGEFGTPGSRAKPRKSLQNETPKHEVRCNLCSHEPFKDASSLRKHVAAAHTRPFPCAFSFAGCTSTFGSKNEWKRHIASQHLCLQYYRCSSCPQSTIEGRGNEFNRKDLFTQHLRRMHAPFAIKKALAKGDGKLQVEWEMHVRDMQQSCLVTRRRPPQRSACPKLDCQSAFEGAGSWDEWTEHVGRHMERGEAVRLGVDSLLIRYALDEGIIERLQDGEYKLCGQSGTNGEKEPNPNSSSVSDTAKQEDEEKKDGTAPCATPGDVASAAAAVAAVADRDRMDVHVER